MESADCGFPNAKFFSPMRCGNVSQCFKPAKLSSDLEPNGFNAVSFQYQPKRKFLR